MSQSRWNISFTEAEHHTLTLEILEDEKLLGHTAFSAAGVEGLITILAGMRMKMTPPVPMERPVPAANGPANPIYAVLDVPVLPGKLLMLRHEGLGWLTFLLPQAEADKMAHGLLEQPALAMSTSKVIN